MPPYQPQHPVLLNDPAFYDPLHFENDVQQTIPSSSLSRNRISSSMRSRETILLDERGLEQALKDRSHRRKNPVESKGVRQTDRKTIDRQRSDSSNEITIRKEIVKGKLASLVVLQEKRRTEDMVRARQLSGDTNKEHQAIALKATHGTTQSSVPHNVPRPQPAKPVKRRLVGRDEKKSGIAAGLVGKSDPEASACSESGPSVSTRSGPATQPWRQTHNSNRRRENGARVPESSDSQQPDKPTITESSSKPSRRSLGPVKATTMIASEDPGTRGGRDQPIARQRSSDRPATVFSNTTTQTPRRAASSRSASESKSVSDSYSSRNHLNDVPMQSSHSSVGHGSSLHRKPKSSSTMSKSSNGSYLNSSSLQRRSVTSWSLRNQNETGFVPNQYITKETMTQYTEALGGVDTVAKTTKIFYDSAKQDPTMEVFFQKIQWENVRNEFIILANLEMPSKYDESIKGVVKHHCQLLEHGVDIERLTALWESAIESSWLENRMDDSRQLIVGPSRVLFNLRAMERQYAMYLMGQRAAARASKNKGSQKAITQDSKSRTGILGLFRKR